MPFFIKSNKGDRLLFLEESGKRREPLWNKRNRPHFLRE
jgi:hypothetical protein